MASAASRAHSWVIADACLKQFRHELSQRWPQIRHIGVTFEDNSGHSRGGMIRALDDEREPVGATSPM